MMRKVLLALFVLHAAFAASPIEHIVILMMENRSFDHLLGWLHANNSAIDGLTGSEFNLANPNDPNSSKYFVSKRGGMLVPQDPGHDIISVNIQIYGFNQSFNTIGTPEMDGFADDALLNKLDPNIVMAMYTTDIPSAPIINTLASDFAVFDRYYCSIPGPTDPNRAFAMSGTSLGVTDNFNGTLWSQQSYFDFLTKHNVAWNAYYQNDPWAVMYFNDTHQPANVQYIHEIPEFFTNVQAGKLASFTWLQPRETVNEGLPTWQHPDATVRDGERLMKQVYETLRAAPTWNKTALIISYDEHGGFYDHVAPPQKGVPPPDDSKAPSGFKFDRLGIRVPMVVVSPWINARTVVHEPSGPTPTSQFEHTSLLATSNKILGITGDLSDRMAWAGTFESVFAGRTEPRTDCPMTLPDLPPSSSTDYEIQAAKPLNHHLEAQVDFYCKFNRLGEGCSHKLFTNQHAASVFIEKQAKIFMKRVKAGGGSFAPNS